MRQALPLLLVALVTGCAAPEAEGEETSLAALEGESFPERAVLDFTWYGQINNYYCGPAATRMALAVRMENAPTQQTLGAFLGTRPSGGTAHIRSPIKALNEWLTPETPYVNRDMAEPPSQAQRDTLKRDIQTRISTGWPIVANVLSGWRPPGYPSGLIGHYVTIVGYEQGGERVLVADPAGEGAAGPAWVNVKRTYWVTLKDLGTWIGGKGYGG